MTHDKYQLLEDEQHVLDLERALDDESQPAEVSRYEALPHQRRRGMALCLSGGGYRAALFHLGSLRRLNELGILSQVTTISSVSGGSIVNAHIATAIASGTITWPTKGETIKNWDEAVTEPVRKFCRHNIRTPAILHRLRPDNWFHTWAGAEGLQAQYEKHLTRLRLQDLPQRPRFIISATDTTFGVNWTFDSGRRRAGDYQAGYTAELPEWPLARAVAASSCFPPVFNPLPTTIEASRLTDGDYSEKDRDELVEGIRLSDGGVYDNMGLEPVWKTRRTILVSDGGAPFSPSRDRGLIWRLNRYASIGNNQAESVRKRWLIQSYGRNDYDGAYWGIESAPSRYREGLPGYSKQLSLHRIAKIRTDLDRFTSFEADVLQTHGYYLVDAAATVHISNLITQTTPPTIPAPSPGDEPALAKKLEKSGRLRILGRGAFE